MTGARCLACGAGDLELWATARDVEYGSCEESFDYRHCRTCGALSIDPVPRTRLAEIYPPEYYSFAEAPRSWPERIKRRLDQRMLRAVCARIPGARLSVLDVGGGRGWMLDAARAADERVSRTQVVDIDPGAEAAARASGHGYFRGRIEDYPSDTRFDLVLMLNLIEHVEDPVAVLAKVGGLLAQGGRILVKTPNRDSLDARLFRHRSWGGYHCPRHWVLFDAPSFAAAARRAGLRIESLAYTQGAPFWAVSVLAALAGDARTAPAKRRPLFRHPLMPALLAAFAAFDFARRPFARTSQMFVHLIRDRA